METWQLISLLLLFCITGRLNADCISGNLPSVETESTANIGRWVVNHKQPSSCPGNLTQYEIYHYDNDGGDVYLALLTPLGNNQYTLVDGSLKQVSVASGGNSGSMMTVSIDQFVYAPSGSVVGAYIPSSSHVQVVGYRFGNYDYGLCGYEDGNATTTMFTCSTSIQYIDSARLHVEGIIDSIPTTQSTSYNSDTSQPPSISTTITIPTGTVDSIPHSPTDQSNYYNSDSQPPSISTLTTTVTHTDNLFQQNTSTLSKPSTSFLTTSALSSMFGLPGPSSTDDGVSSSNNNDGSIVAASVASVIIVILAIIVAVITTLVVVKKHKKIEKDVKIRDGNWLENSNNAIVDEYDNPCELNEAYGVVNSQIVQDTYDYIAVSRSSGTDSMKSFIKMNFNDSYVVKQQPVYIEGKRY